MPKGREMKYTVGMEDRVHDDLTDPGMGQLVRTCLRGIRQILDANGLNTTIVSGGSSGGGGGGGGSTTTDVDVVTYRWSVSGPYRPVASVDGARTVEVTSTITAVWLQRLTPGGSGSTILDLLKDGVSIYTTRANRPTIVWNDSDMRVLCSLPDSTALAFGSTLTVDIIQAETGPRDRLTLDVVAQPA